VPRDYKNAGTRKRGGRNGGLSGGAGLGIGLTLGVVLAAGVHLYHTAGDAERAAEPAGDVPDERAAETAADDERPRPRFDFYRMLPNYEVVIPEHEDVASTADAPAVEAAGVYVLQAGSFRKPEDADRLRAQLALLGVESRIQRVTIDGADTWHRVRIGPVEDLDELQALRQTLARNSVEALVIRVGD
jgi:cell division protein FtsN